ncbi:MAG: LCP family protein [Butyrivibrio sp.]|nr:LCP family protein [Butyrivibrio sp.]
MSNRRDDEFEDNRKRSGNGKRPVKRRRKNKKKAIALFIVEIVILLILIFVVFTLFGKIGVDKVGKVNLNEQQIIEEMNEGVAENETLEGYTNIALFGVDSRDGELDKNTRSDSIIIASINNATSEIKLLSVYRDTYLNLGNDSYNKCNAAYAKGGPDQAISMLNKNLDLDITDFVTIGFRGLKDVVDEVGGVTITVEENEITHLNNYQSTMAEEMGITYTPVTTAGTQTLDGLQATAYCRIRYTAGDDFKRAERQRTVLMAILEKAQGASLSELTDIASKVFEETYTSLDLTEDIIPLLSRITTYTVVANDGFPNSEMRTTGNMGDAGSSVIPVTLVSNVEWLHEFLFEDSTYTVSSDIQEYSDKIDADKLEYLGE